MCMDTVVCGCVSVWMCRCVDVKVCGCEGVWMCRCSAPVQFKICTLRWHVLFVLVATPSGGAHAALLSGAEGEPTH